MIIFCQGTDLLSLITDMFTCPSRLLVVLLAGTLVALAAPAQPEASVIQAYRGNLIDVNSEDFHPPELPVNLTLHTCGFGLK